VKPSEAPSLEYADKLLFAAILLPVCFDFKPPQNSLITVLIQFGLFTVSTLGILVLLMRYRFDLTIKPSTIVKCVLGLFVIHTFTVGLIKDQTFYRLFANSLPFFLFGYSLLIWSYVESRRIPLEQTAQFLAVLACITLVSKPLITLATIELSWETVRYQILPECMPFFLALSVVVIVFRMPRWTWAVLPWTLALCFLSVTRTNLAVLALCFLLVVLTRPREVFSARVLARGGLALTALTTLVVAAALLLPGNFAERWTDRMFSSNDEVAGDVTGLLRIAEVHYQFSRLVESPENLIAGSGLAAESGISGPAAERAAVTQGSRIYQYEVSQIGHNAYTSLIYFGGAIVGVGIVLMLFWMAMQALLILPRISSPFVFAFCLACLAFVAQGFLGGVLGSRQGAMFFGLCCGATLAARARSLVVKQQVRPVRSHEFSLFNSGKPI
jgi:hypothetical protein